MSLDDVLAKIASAKLDELEEKRATRSLEKILARIERGEYSRFAFDGNVFDIPDRLKELITELDYYATLGRTWAKVLDALEVMRAPCIVDLCPGYAPKIELGLYYLGYRGEVVLVDKDARAFDDLRKFLSLFSPNLELRYEVADVFRGPSATTFPFVAANHIADDLAVDHVAAKLGVSPRDTYEKEGALVEVWKRILDAREENLTELSAKLAGMFARFVAPGGTLAVAQYESYVERILELRDVTEFNRELLDRTKSELVARGFEDRSARLGTALSGDGLSFGPAECIGLKRPI